MLYSLERLVGKKYKKVLFGGLNYRLHCMEGLNYVSITDAVEYFRNIRSGGLNI